jgi:hypothetical protein
VPYSLIRWIAATVIAHAITGGNAGLNPPTVSRIVQMSPLIGPLPAPGGTGAPPTGWTVAQFRYLSATGLDVLAQSDVAYVDNYCTFWLQDKAPNQPIRMNRPKPPGKRSFRPSRSPSFQYHWYYRVLIPDMRFHSGR